MLQHVRPAIVMMAMFTLLLGLAYPLAMTGVAGVAFPGQAAGSLVRDARGQVIGRALIAQGFTRPEYLHPRPSAAGDGYDPTASGGSNLGPLDPALAKRIKGDADTISKDAHGLAIPADAVTTSGNGLDPDVSPANAHMQAQRIAKARGVDDADIDALIDAQTRPATLGFIGEPTVNVLALKRALDARFPAAHPKT
jgi:K+-transporting ATPase ATPase C chain